jgi:predicted CoA-binding protein
MPTVAVVGASKNRAKYGNKALRAYLAEGWTVFPVNPNETEIEGLRCYPSVLDIPEPLDRVTLYVPPATGLQLLEEIAQKGCGELYVNPGAESPEVLERARALGLQPIFACSILAVGQSPEDYA